MSDVGTAGVDGFDWPNPTKQEVYYYEGGHSKPLSTTENLDALAAYVMEGADTAPGDEELRDDVGSMFGLASRAAPWLARSWCWVPW